MAHRAAAGSAKNLRDSKSKRLGVKIYGGSFVKSGMIIVRQRGTKFHAGNGVKIGKDDTLYATKPGYVKFTHKKVKKFTGKLEKRTFVNVVDKI